MKIIAFYLPQYHPIPENDRWWGPGFTEWTNVAQARPFFRGHHQPQIPADLGFYDLRLPETRAAQAEMASRYGIGAFCYYHYYFNGRMLLNRPFDEVLSAGEPNFPFCLCWANESWTRRWDGRERDVLMEQRYEAYDPIAHYGRLSHAFADSRYVRVEGRPLFLVYNASSIPERGRVVDGWREAAAVRGEPDPFVCGVMGPGNALSFEEFLAAGFDGVTEFYPTGRRPVGALLRSGPGARAMEIYRSVRERFGGVLPQRVRPAIQSYEKIAREAMRADHPDVFPCVMPSWDNTARRGRRATIIQNDDVGLYREWLERALDRVGPREHDRRIVFVNAWNEWAEGCHLEPDTRNGHRFLEATAGALARAGRVEHVERGVPEPSTSSR